MSDAVSTYTEYATAKAAKKLTIKYAMLLSFIELTPRTVATIFGRNGAATPLNWAIRWQIG